MAGAGRPAVNKKIILSDVEKGYLKKMSIAPKSVVEQPELHNRTFIVYIMSNGKKVKKVYQIPREQETMAEKSDELAATGDFTMPDELKAAVKVTGLTEEDVYLDPARNDGAGGYAFKIHTKYITFVTPSGAKIEADIEDVNAELVKMAKAKS